MVDNITKRARSLLMSKIRSKNTQPEIYVRSYLFKQGFRYRLHKKRLPGSPDIVLKKYRTVIFVHGCFWHGHVNCKQATTPKSNVVYWKNKISANKKRDMNAIARLRQQKWRILIIWECSINTKSKREENLPLVIDWIGSNSNFMELRG